MKSRQIWVLKCYKIFNNILQGANLCTFENQKMASHCRIASGVCGPLNQDSRSLIYQWAMSNSSTNFRFNTFDSF